MTNADRIRAMSDEELAEWLHGVYCCYCPVAHYDGSHCPQDGYCKINVLAWLKKEVEE